MKKVKFISEDINQIRFGGAADPRGVLKLGDVYEVVEEEVHSWHTRLHLKGIPGRGFNSVLFKEIRS